MWPHSHDEVWKNSIQEVALAVLDEGREDAEHGEIVACKELCEANPGPSLFFLRNFAYGVVLSAVLGFHCAN
jgi:hypothetical protein